jgi:hypothetical protein
MRSNPLTLATAGKRLIGPPEGYNKQKGLQIRQWLSKTQGSTATNDLPVIEGEVRTGRHLLASSECASVSTYVANVDCLQPSIYPTESLDEIYQSLDDHAALPLDLAYSCAGVLGVSSAGAGRNGF